MGNKDQPGIIRGVGKYVNKMKYFHTLRQTKKVKKGKDNAYIEERARMPAQIKELEEELLKHKKSGECSKEKKVGEEKDDIDSPRGA